jgi:quercetin dioxygenase-like cupin family protein
LLTTRIENKTMKTTLIILATVIAFVAGVTSATAARADGAAKEATTDTPQMIFSNYKELKWNKIVPDLGENSPEISVLRIDPKTQATSLLIRAPKGIHVRKHWHSANETHTVILGTLVFACEGKRIEQGPGSFNYMPAKMVHEAWLPAGALVFITVDGAWDNNWVEGPPTAADLTK